MMLAKIIAMDRSIASKIQMMMVLLVARQVRILGIDPQVARQIFQPGKI